MDGATGKVNIWLGNDEGLYHRMDTEELDEPSPDPNWMNP